MDETFPITFINLFDKEVLSASAFTLSFLFEKNPDACFLYLFYSYTAKTKEQPRDIPSGAIRADDIYCREKLSWGQVRFYRAKKFLESAGLIYTQTKKSEDGKIGGYFINLYSFRAPSVFVEIPNLNTPTSTKVQAQHYETVEAKNLSISGLSKETSTMEHNIYNNKYKPTTGNEVPPVPPAVPQELSSLVGESSEPQKCQPRTNPCGHCSRCGLFPCTDLEKWEIAKALDIRLDIVQDKHDMMWEMIEAGVFQRKYKKDKTLYLTLKNWLRMDLDRGRIQLMNEFEEMDLAGLHPDRVREREELIRRARERGDI